MKGDFTRFTHNGRKQYTRVLKQQGRVDLDADWNEQVEIERYLERRLAFDVIGRTGVPADDGGFGIRVIETEDEEGDRHLDLAVGSGRMYVDGILCENEDGSGITYEHQPDNPHGEHLSPTAGQRDLVYLDVWERHVTHLDDPDIRDVALGGADTASRVRTTWQVKLERDVGSPDCNGEVPQWASLTTGSGGRLTTIVSEDETSDDPCILPAGGGYRGLSNRLYRVEIHDSGENGDIGEATFKWSRDNGAVVFPVTELHPVGDDSVRLGHVGRDKRLGVQEHDWVELVDDRRELLGLPGEMAQVRNVKEAERIVVLDRAVPDDLDTSRGLKLRRWDHEAPAGGTGTLPTTSSEVPLENGVKVAFSGDRFRTGDYWVFAARTLTRDVEPLDAAPPHGPEHHLAPLAVVEWFQPNDATADLRARVDAFLAYVAARLDDEDLWNRIDAWLDTFSETADTSGLRDGVRALTTWARQQSNSDELWLAVRDIIEWLIETGRSAELWARIEDLVHWLIEQVGGGEFWERVQSILAWFPSETGLGELERRVEDLAKWLLAPQRREELGNLVEHIGEWVETQFEGDELSYHAGRVQDWWAQHADQDALMDALDIIGEWVEDQDDLLELADLVNEVVSWFSEDQPLIELWNRIDTLMREFLKDPQSDELPERTGDVLQWFAREPGRTELHEHLRALFAWFPEQAIKPTVHDLRPVFTPLTALTSGCCEVTVGDGSRSLGRYRSLQAAIDAAPCGGVVCLLPGSYHLEETVVVRRDDVVIHACSGPVRVHAPPGRPAFRFESCARSGLHGLWVAASSQDGAVVVRNCREWSMDECRIANTTLGSAGMDVLDDARRASSDLEAVGPSVSGSGLHGAKVADSVLFGDVMVQGDHILIGGNEIHRGGCRVRSTSSDVSITDNTISNGPADGILVGERDPGSGSAFISKVHVTGNVIHDMTGSGIALDDGTRMGRWRPPIALDVVVERNSVRGCLAGDQDEASDDEPNEEQEQGRDKGSDDTFAKPVVSLGNILGVRVADNEVVGNGAASATPVTGILVHRSFGVEILNNRVEDNGPAGVSGQAGDQSSNDVQDLAAIAAFQVAGTPRGRAAIEEAMRRADTMPVAKTLSERRRIGVNPAWANLLRGPYLAPVHIVGNKVVAPRGRALGVMFRGDAMVNENRLTSLGIADSNFDTDDLGHVVHVGSFSASRAPEEAGSLQFSGNVVELRLVEEPGEVLSPVVQLRAAGDLGLDDNLFEAALPPPEPEEDEGAAEAEAAEAAGEPDAGNAEPIGASTEYLNRIAWDTGKYDIVSEETSFNFLAEMGRVVSDAFDSLVVTSAEKMRVMGMIDSSSVPIAASPAASEPERVPEERAEPENADEPDERRIAVHVNAAGRTLRAMGNRFAETPDSADDSFRATADWAVVLGNQATHCITVESDNPAVDHNHEIRCPRRTTQ